ncbi:MAG: MerR family transcriptional regulator [Lachnospiraceae bacterium]|nr:MerR family transcriptional regulator [Lachnospiraceae bacterium]
MDKKMTSGEIAKKTGVSQKAIRLYDEKGLLKPSDYSEGNYRLYDKEALLVLEKIIALKQIGFSLEEIHDSLVSEKNMNIVESLNRQLVIMEAKKFEIERTITCIRNVLLRGDGEPNWDSVAEIVKMIQMDQRTDERHWEALKHTSDEVDWYVKIYDTLHLKEKTKVLDLGCGFAKLWRNNWSDIPENVSIDGYDLRGSWADNFEEFIEENKDKLAKGTEISLYFEDVEDEKTWKKLNEKESYDYIIAHYLFYFLKDAEQFIQRVSKKLATDGMFSCNGCDVSREHMFWKEVFDDMKLNSDFAMKKEKEMQKKHDEFIQMLQKYFDKVENVKVCNSMKYENCDELFERLCDKYSDKKKYFTDYEKKIKDYFAEKISEQGAIIVPTNADFQHCYK